MAEPSYIVGATTLGGDLDLVVSWRIPNIKIFSVPKTRPKPLILLQRAEVVGDNYVTPPSSIYIAGVDELTILRTVIDDLLRQM